MKGIRKKINTGFLILIVLLTFSGMVSLFELSRLSERTQAVLEHSYHNLELSTRMLDAAQMQNSSLLQMILFDETEYDQAYLEAMREFDNALSEAASLENSDTALDSIVVARDRHRRHIDTYLGNRDTDMEWFLKTYRTVYYNLTDAIKAYMNSSQYSLVSRATRLESNAYRAIMPGIITLGVAIILVLVFMFMIDFYYTQPVVRIQKGLDSSLKHNIPFNVKVEGNDEIAALGDSVERMMSSLRNKLND